MLLDKGNDKKNEYFMVGYDLGEKYSQISYCSSKRPEPETLPVVEGTELYNIPTVLCKRRETNQWFYGKEAIVKAERGEGYLVDHLVSRACSGEQIEIEDRIYDAGALLTIFVKRSFGLFFHLASWNTIETLVITAEKLSEEMIKVLNQIIVGLELKTKKVFFQTYEESYYSYMLGQAEELRQGQAILFDYHILPNYQDKVRKNEVSLIKIFHLDFNRHTIPFVGVVTVKTKEDFPEKIETKQGELENREELDEAFDQIVLEELDGVVAAAIYLIGDGFEGDWMKKSLLHLCKAGRRAFQGNNLYSKGAVYGAYEKNYPSEITQKYVFLGESKLKSNIGIQVEKQGEASYLALLDAGENWYDARAEYELYLVEKNLIAIQITPLVPIELLYDRVENGRVREEKIILDDMPERPKGTTRIRLRVSMTDVTHVMLEIEDLGFGEIFPATHQTWNKRITI